MKIPKREIVLNKDNMSSCSSIEIICADRAVDHHHHNIQQLNKDNEV